MRVLACTIDADVREKYFGLALGTVHFDNFLKGDAVLSDVRVTLASVGYLVIDMVVLYFPFFFN